MDGGVGRATVEQLLVYFVTRGLGLTLEAAIRDAKAAPTGRADDSTLDTQLAILATWKTDRGALKISGIYDAGQSQRIAAHVLFIEWWIGGAHHAGWWRSCRKRPGEWTKGYGTSAVSVGIELGEKSARQARLDAA
jgi:RimJ/RimL family protein N-acetyltransferase